MTLPFALVLAALQLPPAAPPPDTFPDAYLDAAARTLVTEARDRRNRVEGTIKQYTVLSRSRVSVGLRALRRDRMFYRCESASRVEWNRGDTIRVALLGAREVIPVIHAGVRASDGECGGAAFDPTADRLGLALGGGMSLNDSSFLRHPLAAASERDYRFRSGGVTSMRLADGAVIRLHELEVLPRRSDPTLVSGSLWLEDRSHAVVRAVLRLARPFDYDRDAEAHRERHHPESGEVDAEEDDDEGLPRFLRPLRADLRYMTIEYGLWDEQWWLPRLIAFEGEAEVGRLLAVPMKMERSYAEYAIEALAPGEPIPALPLLPADSVCRGDESDDEDEPDHTVSVTVASEGADVRHETRHSCECSQGRCQVVQVTAAVDSMELLHSEFLPPSIYDEGEVFISGREMADLLDRVESSRRPPWQLTPVTWRAGLQGLDLVRYNRVEGLSVGATANLDLGRAAIDGTVRVGIADLAPNFELAASRGGAISRHRIAAYRRLDAVGPATRRMGLGSSLSALLFGRDDGDYYRAWGVELIREPTRGSGGLTWRLFGELQRAAESNTDFSLAGTFGESSFRPNITADEAEQAGMELRYRALRGTDPTGWRGGLSLGVLASAGSYHFARPSVTLSGAAPLPAGLLGGVELSGGTIFGKSPLQSRFFLGGGSTVRGYEGNAARGEAYWTARTEVATSDPGARIVVFSDAGWAGAAEDASLDPLLLSAGAGVSFLDGLVRLDLARALRNGSAWRVELQVDAGL